MNRVFAFISILLICHGMHAQPQPSRRKTITQYIELYKGDAIKDMMKMGVPASITLAQGILESESGNSDLALEARNHFGIKCHKEWTGETFHKDDDEKNECFRKYNSVLESFDDHSRFLRERSRYAFLFDFELSNYKKWAYGLKQAGYATNPRYAEMIINLIEKYDLSRYDNGGVKMPVNGVAANTVVKKSESPSAITTSKNIKTTAVNKNSVPYTIAANGDSWLSVASKNDLRLWQLLKYNDCEAHTPLNDGDIIYLKPKRGNPTAPFHIASQGESLWQISQQYGIKLKKLIRLNNFEEGVLLTEGQKIKLK
jgi:LysM repeat protein